jgi:hypothetical protein
LRKLRWHYLSRGRPPSSGAMNMQIAAESNIGKPVHITGNVRIKFSGGTTRSRWKIQHTGTDADGTPFALGWTDVTSLTDLRLEDPQSVIYDDLMVHGFLGEWIEGNTEILYRRIRPTFCARFRSTTRTSLTKMRAWATRPRSSRFDSGCRGRRLWNSRDRSLCSGFPCFVRLTVGLACWLALAAGRPF